MHVFSSSQRATYETRLAIAHKQIWQCIQLAANAGDEGLEDDLTQLIKEITRMANDSLRGKPVKRDLRLISIDF